MLRARWVALPGGTRPSPTPPLRPHHLRRVSSVPRASTRAQCGLGSSSRSNMKRPLKMQEKDSLNSAFLAGGGPHRTRAVYCAANHPPRTGRATNVRMRLRPGHFARRRERAWSWWTHTRGGNALAFSNHPRCDQRNANPVEYIYRAMLHSATGLQMVSLVSLTLAAGGCRAACRRCWRRRACS